MGQFKDPLIGLLLASAFASLLVQQYDDAISITLAVIIVSTVAFIQEYRSEQSLAALTKLIPPQCHCLRNGKTVMVEARELVPGDVVVMSPGDRVPADCRIIASTEMLVDESSLTGESCLVTKKAEVPAVSINPEEWKACVLFMGTTLNNGHGRALVVATGMHTEFGRTFQDMKNVEKRKTPLQVSMDELGQRLSFISFGVIGVIAAIGLLRGQSLLGMFTIGVSLAVAAIPEGLPICVTVTLALGVMRMASRAAIVKKLPAVEALGCTTVVCVDKTGTLTQNELTVTHMVLPGLTSEGVQNIHARSGVAASPLRRRHSNESELDELAPIVRVSGVGLNLDGYASIQDRPIDAAAVPLLGQLCETACLCNNAELLTPAASAAAASASSGKGAIDGVAAAGETDPGDTDASAANADNFSAVTPVVKQSWNLGNDTAGLRVRGQKTEAALLLAAIKCGFQDPRPLHHRASEVAFSSTRKMMEVRCIKNDTGTECSYVKGTVMGVLQQCVSITAGNNTYEPLTDAERQRMNDMARALARKGLRVLAFAHGTSMHALSLDGLIGMSDPPREGAYEAIEELQTTKARVCMITGDAMETGMAIASDLGFFDPHKHVAMSGAEVRTMRTARVQRCASASL